MTKVAGFSGDQIVAILQLGLSGLAFLLMLFCFSLLQKEQSRKGAARANVLSAIDRFRVTCLIFGVVIALFNIFDVVAKKYFAPPAEYSQRCSDAAQRVQKLSQAPGQDATTLRALIRNGLNVCVPSGE